MTATTNEQTLSARLRAVSFGGAHSEGAEEAAEPGRYYELFLRGGLNGEQVAAQVVQHLQMYRPLEEAARHHDAEGRFPFRFPELDRVPALERDLEFWLGPSWNEQVIATPRIAAYVDRLNEVIFDSVPLFVAHQYTRYLGDLSGGQSIGKRFRKAYELTDWRGAEFYRFEQIDDPRAFKDRYRAALDSYGFTADEIALMEDEVRTAYRLNNRAALDLEELLGEAP
ncbi:hypothetical protein BHE97_16030 [Aeromicrobium sp. PE09-221]|uniref:biliverdin-producing heme oxygenase n=1 Tax=Aeromicrobium sp. PE09-221 TaxID=1898043 RepID=UPI000B3E92BA|nr:biliverdin-producing heme oxygenase [Aeromicrobium sp. PE09-221]OUZ07612.1 hypothetical protein BHE97_16030 [Aeromicrobium sp. PE09-221]